MTTTAQFPEAGGRPGAQFPDTGRLSQSDSEAARRAMIDSQLRPNGVNDPRILTAILRVPREDFVPEGLRSAAYIDRVIPLGGDRFLASPEVHGAMLTEAAPQPEDTALLVGDGAGYLAAVLRQLVGSLDAIDPAAIAQEGVADGPYSLIVIDGAAESLPPALAHALHEDGRIITGTVERGVTRLAAGRKFDDEIALLPLAELVIPHLSAFAVPKRWSF